MIVGARTGKNVSIPLIRRPAKWVLNKLANFLTNYKIPDMKLKNVKRTILKLSMKENKLLE